jgi:hypothetical protein
VSTKKNEKSDLTSAPLRITTLLQRRIIYNSFELQPHTRRHAEVTSQQATFLSFY